MIHRRKKMRNGKILKVLALIMCALMLMTSLAACSRKDTESQGEIKKEDTKKETEDGNTADAEAEEPEEVDPFGKMEEPITVKVVRSQDDTLKFEPGNPDKDSLEVNTYTREYDEQLNVTLEYLWTAPNDQYANKWNLAIASGDLPHMAMVPLDVFAMLAEADMLADMTDLFETYASPLYKEAAYADDGLAMKFSTIDGRLMGLPITGAQADNQPMLFIRKDWLDNLGLEAPKTMDEFYEVAKAFRENDPDQNGEKDTWGWAASDYMNPVTCDMGGFFNGFNAYNDIWIEKDGELVWSTIQPEAKDALVMLNKMYEEDIIAPDFAVKSPWDVAEGIVSEEIGMVYGIFWTPMHKIGTNLENNPEAEWIVVPIPSVSDVPTPQASAAVLATLVVLKDFEHPEAAVKLMNLDLELMTNGDPKVYGTDEDNINIFLYRLASQMYMPWKNLNAQRLIEEANKTGDFSKLNAENMRTVDDMQKAEDGDRSKLPTELVFGENGSFSVVDDYLASGGVVNNQYLYINTETMTEVMGVLQEKTNETYFKIMMGDSLDTFDAMVEDWYKNGGDIITEEVNAWYQSNK